MLGPRPDTKPFIGVMKTAKDQQIIIKRPGGVVHRVHIDHMANIDPMTKTHMVHDFEPVMVVEVQGRDGGDP